MAKFGIIVFPGSNCDHDAHFATGTVLGQESRFIWHKDKKLGDIDVVILPGGFSYGDYLRCGAIARFSPIMTDVVRFAADGGTVFGICNGFQILTEAGLLPGALLQNASLRFACKQVHVRVENNRTRLTNKSGAGDVLQIPIAHGDGNYFIDDTALRRMEERGQILFRYCNADGSVSSEANPNGSLANIAGVMNEAGNVFGMMPHPERASDALLGSTDGLPIFQSLIESAANQSLYHGLMTAERS